MAVNQTKDQRNITNIAIPGCESKATQRYAETRAPPSQEPRDHIEQAVQA